ncbi:MAG: hypothetical protein IAI48_06205 [Candidatus Eremiobacteraeota bacterium]|nr:hypothetical protein [Candidatus Eremiobacteraeota bacterium]
MSLLNVHYAVGFIVVFASLAAIFWEPARRYVLYLLVLQIVVGFAVWGVTKVAPPALHWILAILNGGTYAMGTAFARKGRPRPLIVGAYVVGFVVFAIVFSIGMHAVRG